MSLWSSYCWERLGWETLEEAGKGFISYSVNPPVVVIQELYIEPKERKSNLALHLANTVTLMAKKRGCSEIQTQVWVGTHGAERAMRVNLAYGFKMIAAEGGRIIMRKDIEGV